MVYLNFIKRSFDIVIGLLLIPVFIILFIMIGLIIYIGDKGSIFYVAQRLGKNGKIFYMIKFRTMIPNAPDVRLPDGSTYNSDDDPRLTKVGRILRKTSIDEFPQIINVIKGDMSLIGPRPDTIDNLVRYTTEERIVLTIKPGITGYNQAYYRNSIGSKEKLRNDVYYVKNVTFFFDLKIFFRTIKTVLFRENIINS